MTWTMGCQQGDMLEGYCYKSEKVIPQTRVIEMEVQRCGQKGIEGEPQVLQVGLIWNVREIKVKVRFKI